MPTDHALIPETKDTVRYELDGDDRIVFVNEAWSAFALANGAPHLSGDAVLGRLLWDFIADDSTRQAYRTVMTCVRDGDQSRFGYRCDSPDVRRYMEMTITTCPGGTLLFESVTQQVIPRARSLTLPTVGGRAQDAPALPDRANAGDVLIRSCGWCNRVDAHAIWMELEPGLAELGLAGDDAARVTHGICPSCLERVMSSVRETARG